MEAHTHEFISTAHEDQKFGFSLASGAAMAAVRKVFGTDNLRLVGLHSHVGSQIFDVYGFEMAARSLIGLLAMSSPNSASSRPPRCRSSISVGTGHLLPTRPTTRRRWRTSQTTQGHRGERIGRRRACRCPSSPASRAAPSPGPGTITCYEVGTIKDAIEPQGLHRRRSAR